MPSVSGNCCGDPVTMPFRSISTRLIRSIVLWVALCALVGCLIQAYFSYRQVQTAFDTEVNSIGQANLPLLSVSVWDIEPNAVARQIDAIAQRPQIGYVRLTVATGQVFTGGNPDIGQMQSPRYFDVPSPSRTDSAIGRLEIYANPASFYNSFLLAVAFPLIGYGVLTVLICLLIAVLLRRHLELPLRQIAQYAANLKPENLTAPMALDRAHGRAQDEIDLVVEGFRVLQNGISEHIANLDNLVAQRTDELEGALAAIRELSLTDTLTGTLNRRSFDERIEPEIDRAQRYNRPLSLVFADIDFFKKINDTHGHLVGDQVLQAVATCLRDGIRSDIDWVARFGGEEFVIVLPETDEVSAISIAERLRQTINETVRLPGFPEMTVTASFGVAQYKNGETSLSLIHRADGLLYRAKEAGRDCTFPRWDFSI